MDCLEAQALISAALDHEPVDPDALAIAKEHCRECSECISFVRTLASIQRTPAPQPPEGLAERVAAEALAATAAERVSPTESPESASEPQPEAAPSAPAAAAPGAPAPAAPTPEAERATGQPGPVQRLRTMNRRRLAAGLATAATLLVFVAVASVFGIRALVGPGTGTQTAEKAAVDTAAPQAGVSRAPDTSAPPGETITLPSYVLLDGAVYRLAGASSETTSGRAVIGTVTSSLTASGTPTNHPALATSSGVERIIVSGPDTGYTFTRVTREYSGVTYVLRSDPIASFGVWPTLPTGIQAPSSADGSPTFSAVGQEGGVRVYRLRSGSIRDGIAIPPGTNGSDPASGNPNWTWWTPVGSTP